jgi:purine-binding chemotaxis protein CheW
MSEVDGSQQQQRVETGKELASAAPGQLDMAGELMQYLTFALAGEEYGVDILKVQEIKGWTPVTAIPKAPIHMCGVLNLRGAIVPVIDLRLRFGLEQAEYTKVTVIIVLSISTEKGERVIGVVVDAVSDVLNVQPEQVKQAPDFGSGSDLEFVKGLATINERMVMLLDADKLLTDEELANID